MGTTGAYNKWNVLLLACLSVLFVVFPFWSGMFFAVPTVYSTVYIGLVLLIVTIVAIVRKTEVKGFAWIDLLACIYTVVVLLSIFTYSNMDFTLVGIAKQFAFLFAYFLVRLRLSSASTVRVIFYVVSITGAIFSLYGILAAVNVIQQTGALFGGSGEIRLASVFQYPNTYASYLAIALLFGLKVLSEQKRWWSKALWLFIDALTLSGLIFTYSRGGWVIFAVALLVLLFLAPKEKRVPMIVSTIAILIAMGASMSMLHKGIVSVSASKVVIGVLVELVAAIILAFVLDFANQKVSALSAKKAVFVPILIIIILVCGLAVWKFGLLPKDIFQRITSINLQQFSAQQRLVFYKDGLSALKDHPLFGAGNKTWAATFYKYQSYPYYTTSPHSVFIGLLMDTGIIGTLLFLAIFIMALRGFWRLRKTEQPEISLLYATLFVAMLELVIHGAMDVDFDYGVINYLFWIFAAWGASLEPLAVESETDANAYNWNPKNRWVWWISALVALVVCLYGGSYLYANQQLSAAKSHLGDPAVALSDLDSAHSFAPYIIDVNNVTVQLEERYYARHNDAVILQNMQNTLLSLPSYAPNNADLLLSTGQQLAQFQKPLDGYAMIQKAWVNAPYRSDIAGQASVFAEELGEAYLRAKDPVSAKQYFQQSLNTYQELQQRIAGLKTLPPVLHLERPYAITWQMNAYAGKSAFYLGQYAQTEQMAAQGLQDPQADKVQLMALQAAAEQKQEKAINPQVLAFLKANKAAEQQYNAFLKQP